MRRPFFCAVSRIDLSLAGASCVNRAMILQQRPSVNRARQRLAKTGAVVAVVAIHLALGLWLGMRTGVADPVVDTPVMWVDLVAPVVSPPEPPPPESTSPTEGGGAPAATSAVRVPRLPPPTMPEILAPPVPAEEPPLVVGVAPQATPTSGMGQGGQGDGTGRGTGSGAGDGSGGGPRFITGPTTAQLRALHPREAFRRRQGGHVQLACKVGLDSRLRDCRVVAETPVGAGFGTAALAAAQYFRFRPGTLNGAPVDGADIRVGVEWP